MDTGDEDGYFSNLRWIGSAILEYSTIVSLSRPVFLVQACLDLSASELLNLVVRQVHHFVKPDIFETPQVGRYPRDEIRRVYFHQLFIPIQ